MRRDWFRIYRELEPTDTLLKSSNTLRPFGDLFRPPALPGLLALAVGNGSEPETGGNTGDCVGWSLRSNTKAEEQIFCVNSLSLPHTHPRSGRLVRFVNVRSADSAEVRRTGNWPVVHRMALVVFSFSTQKMRKNREGERDRLSARD